MICLFGKDPYTTLGFWALKWPLLTAPIPCPVIRNNNFYVLCGLKYICAKICVARAAIRIRLMVRFLGAPKASLGGPALRRFRCLCQRASSVRIRMFLIQKTNLF